MNGVAQQIKTALGSDATLIVVGPEPILADNLSALWAQIDAFEQAFSRFLPTSELSAFNRAAGAKTPISADFRRLLLAAKRYGQSTQGIFNPFVLPIMQRVGYTHSWTDPTRAGDDHSLAELSDIEALEIGPDWARIPPRTALDLGGIGKGYLLDQLAAALPAALAGYCFSLGGDILAGGSAPKGKPWLIPIALASQPGVDAAHVTIPLGSTLAVATSGTTKRRGVGPAGPWHHLIDPRTGQPSVSTVLTATVCARSATAADIAATCAVITGATPALTDPSITDSYLQFASPAAPIITGQHIEPILQP